MRVEGFATLLDCAQMLPSARAHQQTTTDHLLRAELSTRGGGSLGFEVLDSVPPGASKIASWPALDWAASHIR